MSNRAPGAARADYGLDAPGVVRNLALVAVAGLALTILVAAGMVPASLSLHAGPRVAVTLDLRTLGLGPALGCGLAAAAMLWSSRVGKVRGRERLLDAMPWAGDERVLDIGCGRGLLLIGAAHRLRSGHAMGIDLWRAEDLSGNRVEATLANARAEGVADRVMVQTADMRRLPFRAASFDRVVSSVAIHNLSRRADRAEAIGEIARVMRPGGLALVDDIRHFDEYLGEFAAAGCRLVRRLDHRAAGWLWTVVSFGSLRPGTLLVRKDD